jgi:hypothetical protein
MGHVRLRTREISASVQHGLVDNELATRYSPYLTSFSVEITRRERVILLIGSDSDSTTRYLFECCPDADRSASTTRYFLASRGD